MNRRQRKLKYIRTKNAYRILKISYTAETSITTSSGIVRFSFDDVAGHRGKTILFTNEFYNRIEYILQ